MCTVFPTVSFVNSQHFATLLRSWDTSGRPPSMCPHRQNYINTGHFLSIQALLTCSAIPFNPIPCYSSKQKALSCSLHISHETIITKQVYQDVKKTQKATAEVSKSYMWHICLPPVCKLQLWALPQSNFFFFNLWSFSIPSVYANTPNNTSHTIFYTHGLEWILSPWSNSKNSKQQVHKSE